MSQRLICILILQRSQTVTVVLRSTVRSASAGVDLEDSGNGRKEFNVPLRAHQLLGTFINADKVQFFPAFL